MEDTMHSKCIAPWGVWVRLPPPVLRGPDQGAPDPAFIHYAPMRFTLAHIFLCSVERF
jgi:hypothetical protein